MTAGWRLEGSGHAPVWHELLSPGLPAVSQNLISGAGLGPLPPGAVLETWRQLLRWAGSRGSSGSWSALPRPRDPRRGGSGGAMGATEEPSWQPGHGPCGAVAVLANTLTTQKAVSRGYLHPRGLVLRP